MSKIKKDFSYTGKAYKTMLEANVARTEESAEKNSNWAPGALGRLTAKKEKPTKICKRPAPLPPMSPFE